MLDDVNPALARFRETLLLAELRAELLAVGFNPTHARGIVADPATLERLSDETNIPVLAREMAAEADASAFRPGVLESPEEWAERTFSSEALTAELRERYPPPSELRREKERRKARRAPAND